MLNSDRVLDLVLRLSHRPAVLWREARQSTR